MLVPRFSNVATVGVALVVGTGSLAAIVEVKSLARLFGTLYGRLLIVKLAIVLPLVAIGGFNFLFTVPALKRGTNRVRPATLSKLVAAEAILGALVLVAAGALTGASPNAGEGALGPTSFVASAISDRALLNVTLEVSPGQAGFNHVTATLLTLPDRAPLATAKKVTLDVSLPARHSLGMSTIALAKTKPGVFEGDVTLGFAGAWTLALGVSRTDAFDDGATFTLPVGYAAARDSQGGALNVTLEATPATQGINHFVVRLADRATLAPVNQTKAVGLYLNLQGRSDLGVSAVALNQTSPGTYEGDANLGLAGTWVVTVAVQRPGATDDAASFPIQIR
jgi:hypothetical protein